MNQEVIKISIRGLICKSSTKSLRKIGLIPAIIYGSDKESVAISISPKSVAKVISSDAGINSIIHLEEEDTGVQSVVIIKDLQRHPVTGRLRHIDFLRIDGSRNVCVKVQIKLIGTPIGVKEGGVLDFTHREIEIECLPSNIPLGIDLKVDNMKIGDSLRIEQLVLNENLKVISKANEIICSVVGKKQNIDTVSADKVSNNIKVTDSSASASTSKKK